MESFHGLLREHSKAEQPFVLLDTSLIRKGEGTSYFFKDPVAQLTISHETDLDVFFNTVEHYLKKGYWLAGWFAYEFGYLLERRLHHLLSFRHPSCPLVWLGVFEEPLIFHHDHCLNGKVLDIPGIQNADDLHVHGFDTSEQEYKEAIARIKDYIRSGDTYQVNYTIRGRFSFDRDPVLLYEALRAKQPVPYGGFISACGMTVLSLSPELFFRIRNGFIESRPMKGTVERGRFLEEDAAKARWLFQDEKNRAENVMIVDLIRNDLGRVCSPGTVTVPQLFQVERYETLFQMTSLVRGRLEKGEWCARDVFKALFPCGSVTGAPKIRTMEIIAELENSPRGIYCGAIGYMHRSKACFNVAIRTVTMREGRGEIGIGSGVTMDSVEEGEYGESILKMDFLTKPLEDFTLMETMLVDEAGTIPYLSLHMERLKKSVQYFSFSMDEKKVLDAIKRKVQDSDMKRPFILRLSLKRDGELDLSSRAFYKNDEPVHITLSSVKIDPSDKHLYHKTSIRGIFDQELKKAQDRGFFECIFLNTRGEVTQGSFTNVFLEKDGVLFTPPVDAGLLPGVLRAHLLSSGVCRERRLGLEDLKEGTLYVGNSVRGLLRASIALTR